MNWRFAERMPSYPDGFAVYPAATDSDLDEVEKMWQAVYGHEYGWLPADAPVLHKDNYHPYSVYLLAAVSGSVVGTMRLVMDSAQRLPIEQFASIDVLRGDGDRRMIECQRLMILADVRNKRYDEMPFGVFAALVKGCLHWCLRNHWSHIVADLFLDTATTPMTSLLALGCVKTDIEFVDTELDEPSRSVALLLDTGELFSRSYRCDNPFYRYLSTPDDVVAVYG